MRLKSTIACWLTLVICASAQSTIAEINTALKGKIHMVRGFPRGNRIEYTASGEPMKPIQSCPWTVAGIKVERVKFKGNHTVIQGSRTGFTPEKDIVLGTWDLGQKMELVIAGDISALGKEDYAAVLLKVFLRNDEDWSGMVPEYWKPYMKHRYAQQHGTTFDDSAEGVLGPEVKRVGPGIKPPRAIFNPDPKYEEYARRAKYQGVVVLHLVITETGIPTNIRLARVLGLGLDDAAVEAVRKWKFEPAKKDGKPVPVAINVEVNFNLY